MSVYDGLVLALADRGLAVSFDAEGLRIEPWRGR
jgi:hypothetical protein